MNAIGQRSDVAQTGTGYAGARSITRGYDTVGRIISAASAILGLNRACQHDSSGGTTVSNKVK